MGMICKNFCTLNKEEVENFISSLPNSDRKKFLCNAHSLWIRFRNYEKQLPIAIIENSQLKSIAFVSKLKKHSMINLYDIVSFDTGYGKKLWMEMIAYYYNLGVRNIKFRALYSAVKFYDDLGIYFWGFDGKSFTVEQPLYSTIEEMQKWRNDFILSPICANDKLLEDKDPSKKIKYMIDDIKICLDKRYYLNRR